MMWAHYDRWNLLLMTGLMILLWSGVIALVVWTFLTVGRPWHGSDLALAELRRQLASGQISPEEFEKTRKSLQV